MQKSVANAKGLEIEDQRSVGCRSVGAVSSAVSAAGSAQPARPNPSTPRN